MKPSQLNSELAPRQNRAEEIGRLVRQVNDVAEALDHELGDEAWIFTQPPILRVQNSDGETHKTLGMLGVNLD